MTNAQERNHTVPTIEFGLRDFPLTANAVWGARLIFPASLLHDRQSFPGMETEDGAKLKAWLNKGGALKKALAQAAKLAKRYHLSPDGGDTVTLYQDNTGVIKANPQSSYGYLYVCAYLQGETK